MKQTAVEWLVDKLNSKYGNDDFIITHINEIEQAKEMEKEQICNAWDEGKVEGMCLAGNPDYNHLQGHEYYEEEYKR